MIHLDRNKRYIGMRTAKAPLTSFVIAAFACSGAANAQDKQLPKIPDAEYRICTGDVLQISVYQHPELSKTTVVSQEGNITLPTVRVVVKAVGLSPLALASLLRDKLQSAVPNAGVTIIVRVHSGPLEPLRPWPWPRDIIPPQHPGQSES